MPKRKRIGRRKGAPSLRRFVGSRRAELRQGVGVGVGGSGGVGCPGGGNLEVVGVIGAKKAEPLLHAMNDGVAEGHGEDLGDGAELGYV